MKTVMIISGIDPSGGAGFVVDVAVASFLGVTPCGVVTNLTVQNAAVFKKNYQVAPEVIKEQIKLIIEEHRPDAVKIGMLGDHEMILAVNDIVREYNLGNIVLDPLMISSTGYPLTTEKAFSILEERLLPLTYILTPNINEAVRLANSSIGTAEEVAAAAEFISEKYGCRGVLIKGGHLGGDPLDTLYFDGRTEQLTSKRIEGDFHGTGCILSTSLASFLAKGKDAFEAFSLAKRCQQYLIENNVNGKWSFKQKKSK